MHCSFVRRKILSYGLWSNLYNTSLQGNRKKDSNCRIIENNYKTKHPFQIINLEKSILLFSTKVARKDVSLLLKLLR